MSRKKSFNFLTGTASRANKVIAVILMNKLITIMFYIEKFNQVYFIEMEQHYDSY